MAEQRPGGTITAMPDSIDGHVVLVTITNPRRANALDAGMLDDLEALAATLAQARAVVVTGDGERHFCAGADIDAWGALAPQEYGTDWVERGNRALDVIAGLPGVVIAAINGTCLGGGLELALRCDLRLAAAHARFAFPETGLGMVPGWRGASLLAEVAGKGTAARLVLAGATLDAPAALQAGIVADTLPTAADVVERALALAREVAQRSPVATTAAKRLLWPRTDADSDVVQAAVACKASADCAEGLAAFAARRPPRFQDPPTET